MSSSKVDRRPTRPTRPPSTLRPRPTSKPVVSQSQSPIGTAGWIFIGLGSAIVVFVLLSCIYLSWRTARKASQPFRHSKRRMRTGRAIERPSFLPFRFTRQATEPVVLEVPDSPNLPNYAIRTPYTFPSSIFSSSPGSGRDRDRDKDFEAAASKTPIKKWTNEPPSSRATII